MTSISNGIKSTTENVSEVSLQEEFFNQTGDFIHDFHAKIIIGDVWGNVLIHNLPNIKKNIQLRKDIRDFIVEANMLRESFLLSDSAFFQGNSIGSEKRFQIHIFRNFLFVLIIHEKKFSRADQSQLDRFLFNMELISDILIKNS